jgi:hypothetical protein
VTRSKAPESSKALKILHNVPGMLFVFSEGHAKYARPKNIEVKWFQFTEIHFFHGGKSIVYYLNQIRGGAKIASN